MLINKYKKIVVPNYKEILADLGYKLVLGSGGYRTRAVYRNGKNHNSMIVNEEGFYDFGTARKGTIVDLVSLTTGIDPDEFDYLVSLKEKCPKINLTTYLNSPKYYSDEILKKLSPNYEYFQERGISRETQIQFECGLVREGKMSNRVVFPIRDKNKKIIGFAGRFIHELPNPEFPKWVLLGFKRFFNYNLLLSEEETKRKGFIILVESVGDLLSFHEAGIHNVACCFGIKVHKTLLKYIISNRLGAIVSFNNDERKQGQDGASKAVENLSRFINPDKIVMAFPELNDWNDELKEKGASHLRVWYNEQLTKFVK